MNGVEILASEEVAIAWAHWNWKVFFGIAIAAFILAVLFGVVAGLQEGEFLMGASVFALIFISGIFIIGPMVAANTGKPVKYETHYKVTIDVSVSMNEFLDKYEILEQEGKIYTVKERNK